MLTVPYIEALLADEELADAFWLLWDRGLIGEEQAVGLWLMVAVGCGEPAVNWRSGRPLTPPNRTFG